MGNSRFKFRAWDKSNQCMVYPGEENTVFTFTNGILCVECLETVWKEGGGEIYEKDEFFQVDCEIMQFTGLKDKNGKEIYPNDLLRIKGTMGENSQYKFDCIYRVNEINYEGLSLSFVGLFNQEPDSVDNSYPISQHPSFKYNSLCTDYVNSNYENIAFSETHGNNPTFRQTWKQHDYTNDIELIGNIYENPELLK